MKKQKYNKINLTKDNTHGLSANVDLSTGIEAKNHISSVYLKSPHELLKALENGQERQETA
jgi:hypothetical protein